MLRSCLLAATAVLSPSLAPAQTPTPVPQPNCDAAVRRQFDFWAGEWSVSLAPNPLVVIGGEHLGNDRIDKILGGCALLESWTGAGGASGTSLSFYDPAREQWHQTRVDDRGGSLALVGTFTRGSMVLSGTRKDEEGKTMLNRISWTPLPSGQVRQVWETSSDGGKSWTVVFDGLYTRKQ
jgi:hypothetical protein